MFQDESLHAVRYSWLSASIALVELAMPVVLAGTWLGHGDDDHDDDDDDDGDGDDDEDDDGDDENDMLRTMKLKLIMLQKMRWRRMMLQ